MSPVTHAEMAPLPLPMRPPTHAPVLTHCLSGSATPPTPPTSPQTPSTPHLTQCFPGSRAEMAPSSLRKHIHPPSHCVPHPMPARVDEQRRDGAPPRQQCRRRRPRSWPAARSDIPHSHHAIRGGCGQPPSTGAEAQPIHPPRTGKCERGHQLLRSCVHKAHGVGLSAGGGAADVAAP